MSISAKKLSLGLFMAARIADSGAERSTVGEAVAVVGVTPTFAAWLTGMPFLRSSLLSWAAAVSAAGWRRGPRWPSAFVHHKRRERPAVGGHAGLPRTDGADVVEIAVVAHDAAVDPLDAGVLEGGDEVTEPRGLQVEYLRLVSAGREARIAEALEVEDSPW